MLTQSEFDRRVQENTETYKVQYANSAFDVTKYHLAHKEKGKTSIPMLLKHIHDVYGAVMTGCLPTLTGKGFDAIHMEDGISRPIELKTSYVTSEHLWSNNGVLYASSSRERSGKKVETQLRAEYHLYSGADSKMIDTTLICMDSLSGELICAYSLPAHAIYTKLAINNTIRKTISLKHFMEHGHKTDTIISQIGFDIWYKKMVECSPKGFVRHGDQQ